MVVCRAVKPEAGLPVAFCFKLRFEQHSCAPLCICSQERLREAAEAELRAKKLEQEVQVCVHACCRCVYRRATCGMWCYKQPMK